MAHTDESGTVTGEGTQIGPLGLAPRRPDPLVSSLRESSVSMDSERVRAECAAIHERFERKGASVPLDLIEHALSIPDMPTLPLSSDGKPSGLGRFALPNPLTSARIDVLTEEETAKTGAKKKKKKGGSAKKKKGKKG